MGFIARFNMGRPLGCHRRANLNPRHLPTMRRSSRIMSWKLVSGRQAPLMEIRGEEDAGGRKMLSSDHGGRSRRFPVLRRRHTCIMQMWSDHDDAFVCQFDQLALQWNGKIRYIKFFFFFFFFFLFFNLQVRAGCSAHRRSCNVSLNTHVQVMAYAHYNGENTRRGDV